MAKHCDVCNKSYPETEAHCPHCGAAAEPRLAEAAAVEVVELADEPQTAEVADDAVEIFQVTAPATGSDSAVDLGEPVVAELASSASGIAVVEEVPPGATANVEMLSHATPETTPAPAAGAEPFVAEAASGVELGGAAAEDSAVTEAMEESSAIDLGALAAGGSSNEVRVEITESSGGEVNAEPVIITPEGRPASEAAAGAAPADTHDLDDLADVEAGSTVNLGDLARSADRASSRDLIAEAVESGVDLAGERARAEEAVEGVESAVDLGSAAGEAVSRSDSEAVGERRGSRAEVDLDAVELTEAAEIGEEPEQVAPHSSAVDLGGPSRRRAKGPSSKSSEIGMDERSAAAEEEPAVAEAEAEAAAAAALAAGEEAAAAEAPEDEETVPTRAKTRRAAAEAEDEEPTAKPPRGRSGAGCLMAGTALGLLLGVGTAFGLWLFGIEPPKGWKLAAEPKMPPSVGQQGGPKVAAGPTVADAGQQLKYGEFAKAVEGFQGAPEAAPEVLGQRGTARWLAYLQDKKAKGEKINPDDDQVKQARADLQTAAEKDPEAELTLGNLEEWTGAPDQALKTYQEGLTRFGTRPAWARAFQAQIDRMETVGVAPPPAGVKPTTGALRPRRAGDPDDAARALYAVLIAFQAGQTPPPAGDADAAADEAGFEFWKAVKLARGGDYAAAIKALDAARAAHDKLRFSRLRKAQNPLSDPTEEIFLRSADQIKDYWRLQEYLAQQKLLARGVTPVQAVEGAVKSAADLQARLTAVAGRLKTTPDKIIPGIDALAKEKTAAEDRGKALQANLTTAEKNVETARTEAKALKDQLTLSGQKLTATEGKLKAVGDRVEQLTAERNAADKTLADVAAKVADAGIKVDRANLLRGVSRLVETAKVKDPKGELIASKEEVKRLDSVLAERHTPKEMLDIWLPIVADRDQKEEAPKAIVDASRAAEDPRADAATRGKAFAVIGLARRDLGEYEPARNLMHNGLVIAGDKGDWQPAVVRALRELNEPGAYYLPRARGLYEAGQYKEALDVLAEAEKVFPKGAAALLPLRAQVRLELAREKDKGKLDAADPLVAGAKRDAETAAAAGNAEGHYVLGRIAEELGNLAEARASYAKALAAHEEKDDAGGRYRIALARVLLRMQAEKPAGGRAAAAPLRSPLAALVLLIQLKEQAGPGADVEEANRLADEVLAGKDGPDGFLLRAQALAIKGLWTKALTTYAEGLRSHIRRDYADELIDLISRHPALRRPDSLAVPNPLLAQVHYATGLRGYFARRYADAEAAFTSAIEADNQDARYFYFLGLSRLALGQRDDANADFEEGARLEMQNRPGREAVSTALERVQGTPRQVVNRFRP